MMDPIKITVPQFPDRVFTATWKDNTGRYVTSNDLLIGGIKVASYFLNGMRPKGDPLQYKAVSHVEGFRPVIGNYKTEKECQDNCLDVAKYFLKRLHD